MAGVYIESGSSLLLVTGVYIESEELSVSDRSVH